MRQTRALFLAALVCAGCGQSSNAGERTDAGAVGLPDTGAPGDVTDPGADSGLSDTEAPTGPDAADPSDVADPPPDATEPDAAEPDATPSDAGPDAQVDDEVLEPPPVPMLVISEIMYDPKASGDPDGEWVELFNPSLVEVDLTGWVLRDKGSNEHVIAGPAVVPGGGYAVLGANGDPAANGGYVPTYVYSDFYLGNSGDSVVIERPDGVVADEVSYGVEAPWPSLFGGVSIEVQSFGADNALASAWGPAVVPFGAGDLGTPGAPNGQPEPSFDVIEGVGDWQQPDLKASLLFSPHDDLEAVVLGYLAGAQTSVSLGFFNVRLPQVLWALEDLMAAGVAVDVILDAKQQALEFNTMGEELVAKGIPVTLVDNAGATDATMHHKVIVIDGQTVLTGSANLSYTALNVSDEDLLVVDSADLAARFAEELTEIKTAGADVPSAPYPAGAPLRALMGPEDDLDGEILGLLEGAQSTVEVAMFQLNQAGLIQALVDAHARGVNVVVILDELYLADAGAVDTLAAAGVHVLLVQNTGGEFSEMHSKLLVVDQSVVAMGSYNWTNLASFYNHEALVVIDDDHLAARAGGKIADLVTQHLAADPTTVGLTTGDRAITFQVDNLTLHEGATLQLQPVSGALSDPVSFSGTTATVTLAAGATVSYRYAVAGPGGVVLETGALHRLTVPFGSGPLTIRDAFRL